MFRGTNPALSFRVKSEFDFSTIKEAWITISSWDVKRTFKLSKEQIAIDEEARTISAYLSQEDTLAFEGDDTVDVQMRLLDNKDNAYATKKTQVEIGSILEDGVIGLDDEEENGGG